MDNEKKNLLAFGFGISLLIPFLMTFRVLHSYYNFSNFWVLIISFVFLLFIISRTSGSKPGLQLWILIVYGAVAYLKVKTGYSIYAFCLGIFGLVVLITTIVKLGLIKPLYSTWMPVAHFIGTCISTLFLSLLFYIVFAPVGLILRIINKDLLNRKIDKNASSYWIEKEKHKFDQKRYTQQF